MHWWNSPHIENQHTIRLKLLHLTLLAVFPSLSSPYFLSHYAPSVAITIYSVLQFLNSLQFIHHNVTLFLQDAIWYLLVDCCDDCFSLVF